MPLTQIIGANSGIGYETVGILATVSHDFEILLGCRSLEKGEKALAELRATYGELLKSKISVLQLDITKQVSINAAREHVKSTYGKLDVLINNAGIIVTRDAPFIEKLRETFETNTFAPALVTDTFEELLKISKSPLIIYVSSDQGSVTNRSDPTYQWYTLRGDPYQMSKAALNMLSACHKFAFAEWGCRVCAYNPGFCVTNLTGPKGYEIRKKLGARDPKEAAEVLVQIVKGKKDEDIAKTGRQSGLIDAAGGVTPW